MQWWAVLSFRWFAFLSWFLLALSAATLDAAFQSGPMLLGLRNPWRVAGWSPGAGISGVSCDCDSEPGVEEISDGAVSGTGGNVGATTGMAVMLLNGVECHCCKW